MKKLIIIAVVALLAIGSGIFYFKNRKPAITYKTAKLEKGTIVATVSATGNLSAVTIPTGEKEIQVAVVVSEKAA